MNATDQDIAVLLKLQEVDRKVATAQKEFDKLPHRKAILEVRGKKEEIFKKKVQVQDLLDDAEGKLADLTREDEQLQRKQDEITAQLTEVQQDYRAVTAQTRELDGVRKRREKISLALAELDAQIGKINPVMKQIMQGMQALDDKERELVESFQKTGGSLKGAIAEGAQAREKLASSLEPSLLAVYEKTREHCGGVALAQVQEHACSACRNAFDQSRMSKIRSQAPLATCPSCGRLLVVPEGE